MNLPLLKEQFYRAVLPSQPQEWEVEEALEPMLELETAQQQALLSHIHAVWPVSQSLCVSYIEYGAQYISRLMGEDLAEWVRQCLSRYEQGGLRGARNYMSELDDNFYASLIGLDGAHFDQVKGRLLHFIRGVSGHEFQLAPLAHGREAWTDGETIYLPRIINYFSEPSDNELFFNFLACCQWGYVQLGALGSGLVPESDNTVGLATAELEGVFAGYGEPELARNTYHFLNFALVFQVLAAELPGLIRVVRPLLQYLVSSRRNQTAPLAEGIYYSSLLALVRSKTDILAAEGGCLQYPVSCKEIIEQLPARYQELHGRLAGGCFDDWYLFADFAGVLKLDLVEQFIRRRRSERKQLFIEQLAAAIRQHFAAKTNDQAQSESSGSPGADAGDGGRLVVSLAQGEGERGVEQLLTINNESVELPSELRELAASISNDLGAIPEGYLQAAAGVAGRAMFTSGGRQEGQSLTAGAVQVHLYDEWDFRRQGYRTNWCGLIEKEIQPVKSSFIQRTQERYRGVIRQLRRQFEMLRIEHRFVRRRRFGDDIDFDAVVEARGDQLAGRAPSDRLFVRLLRDDRDIAVMFLVDMSNSTEGWVGKAIKEALVLLTDVLEVVGDRYAIYGFSGMRRSRCELFRIKEMDEPYGAAVEQRICGISPREYTRMAPAIRHLTSQLADTDARVRLLITLTDGKPEDYDDYRGEYAIEDTRQALIEARGKGVNTFSITVDRQAHSYLSHMCGRYNSIFVDKVQQLPQRLPEIYRLMTS